MSLKLEQTKEKRALRGVDALDQADAFNGFLIENITPEAINRIRGIYNHPSLFEGIYQPFNYPRLWILGVNGYQHSVSI